MNSQLLHLRNLSAYCSARELAHQVLEVYFNGQKPEFPINIFQMLADFGVQYKFFALENLEGLYAPEKEQEGLLAAVAINSDRPYERQRFTAAHELCHHIKDYNLDQVLCPINSNDPIERYANEFAANLLMPATYLLGEVAKHCGSSKVISADYIPRLCPVFGVSFQSVTWQLHNFGCLDFKPSRDFFRGFNLTAKKDLLNIPTLDRLYLRQIIDNYAYVPQANTSPLWYRIKNELIYHDSRIEGVDIEQTLVSEICTDIRLYGRDSRFFQDFKTNKSIIETVGHTLVYDFLGTVDAEPDQYQIQELNRILFSLSPHPEVAGEYRTSDNEITGALIQTVHHSQIRQEMYYLDHDGRSLLSGMDGSSFSDFLSSVVKIHHRLTQIHPFSDGNGRVSRALMNWLLRLKNLPPVFVTFDQKSEYLMALQQADAGDEGPIFEFFLHRLLYALIQLNSDFDLHVPVLNMAATPHS